MCKYAFMIRSGFIAIFCLTGTYILSTPGTYAQTTDQTDASEEDWRRSQRKARSRNDTDTIINTTSIGAGAPLPEYRPIDSLPEESRRHLQRQRAKIIAEVEFGEDPGEVPFEPSEAAKTDPNLAADEEEAWEVILTDLRSSGSNGQGEGGPNKVAVAGRGGGASSSVTRGGSAQSAADILAQLKGLQTSGTRPSTSGASPSGTGAPTDTGGSQTPAGQNQAQTTQADPTGQATQGGAATSANGQGGEDASASGQGSSGSGQASGGAANGGGSGADGTGGSPSSASPETPFSLPDDTDRPDDTRGSASSASEFLKDLTGTSGSDSDTEADNTP